MVRSIMAVIVGYLIFGVSAVLIFKVPQADPHAPASPTFMIITTFLGMVAALLAGVVAANLAPQNGLRHAVIVSVIIAAGSIISVYAMPGAGTAWSQTAALILMAPSATVGGCFQFQKR